MIRKMSIKSNQLYLPLMPLYSRYVILPIMILIDTRSCRLFHNYDDVVFTWIPCMINLTLSKMVDGILKYFNMLLFCSHFILQSNIFILYGLYCFSRSCRSSLSNGTAWWNCLLVFFNSLLMFHLHFSTLSLEIHFTNVIALDVED